MSSQKNKDGDLSEGEIRDDLSEGEIRDDWEDEDHEGNESSLSHASPADTESSVGNENSEQGNELKRSLSEEVCNNYDDDYDERHLNKKMYSPQSIGFDWHDIKLTKYNIDDIRYLVFKELVLMQSMWCVQNTQYCPTSKNLNYLSKRKDVMSHYADMSKRVPLNVESFVDGENILNGLRCGRLELDKQGTFTELEECVKNAGFNVEKTMIFVKHTNFPRGKPTANTLNVCYPEKVFGLSCRNEVDDLVMLTAVIMNIWYDYVTNGGRRKDHFRILSDDKYKFLLLRHNTSLHFKDGFLDYLIAPCLLETKYMSKMKGGGPNKYPFACLLSLAAVTVGMSLLGGLC